MAKRAILSLLIAALSCGLLASPTFGAGGREKPHHLRGPAVSEAMALTRPGNSKSHGRQDLKGLEPVGGGSTAPVQGEAGGGSTAEEPSVGAEQSGLNLAWSDEFNGPAGNSPDPTKWQALVGGNGWGNNELEYYTQRADNVALDGSGQLAITARRETYSGSDGTRQFTSGQITTKGLFSTTYGRIEASIRIPAGQGLWPAFWAVGENNTVVGWPNCGEIDFMEALGQEPNTLYGSVHGPVTGSDGDYGITNRLRVGESLAGGYHVYGAEWTPREIAFTFDGSTYAKVTPASLSANQQWVFDTPFFLRLNLAVGGEWPGSPTASTPFPAQMLVDWVRVWK